MSYHELQDYFDINKPLAAYVSELGNMETFPTHAAPGVKERVLGLVQRYSLSFHGVRSTNIADAQRELERIGNPSDGGYMARRCLRDVPSTAALVQELAFTPTPLRQDGSVHFADNGTGSGVLPVGALISALRSGAKEVVGHCVDRQESLLHSAAPVLSEAAAGRADFRFQKADSTKPELYLRLPVRLIQSWISETISGTTWTPHLSPHGLTWTGNMGEPYPEILDRILQTVPDFYDNVKIGRTHLFPDVINGDYLPASAASLRLKTSESHAVHAPLNEVGKDFSEYETITSDRRWGAHPW